MSRACLGDLLSALVDGELDHAERERAFAHLAGCAGCREEVDGQRRLKARLSALDAETSPPPQLTGRLLGLAVPGDAGPRRPQPLPVGPQAARPPARPSGRTRPAGRPAASRLRRRHAAGALLAVGLGAALALGGPSGGRSSTPVDPGADVFVVEHASTTGNLPLRPPATRAATLPAR